MKRFSMITLLMLVCSVATYSQIWIAFGWNDSHCRDCEWMERSLRMTDRQARDYHNIVHKYGQKIEKEARKEYKHWDKAYRKIYDLRMDRDRKLQRILSPQQFGLYIRLTREQPIRIHDYRGWYENPRYTGYRILPDWRRYEDTYWSFRWDGRDYRNYRWDDHGRYDSRDYRRDNHDPRFDNRPPANAPRNDNRYDPPRNQSAPGQLKSQPAPGNNKNKDKNGNNGNNKNTPGTSKENRNSSKDNSMNYDNQRSDSHNTARTGRR